MKRGTTIGLVVGMAALVFWAGSQTDSSAWAQGGRPPARVSTQGSVSLVTLDANETGDHLVLMDPAAGVLCTYFIQRDNGAIHLRSVRNVSWDMQLEQYNPTTPSPNDIKAVIEGRP